MMSTSLHRAEQFGEAQVVADRQADTPERAVYHHHLVARLYRVRLVVIFVAQFQVEQMNLVIARHLLAVFIEHQAGIPDLVRRARRQRDRSAHQPYFVLARGFAEERLDRAPDPDCSRTLTLSCSVMPMMAKNSGNTTRRAPCAAALAIRRRASLRLPSTFGPEAIWIAATLNALTCAAMRFCVDSPADIIAS